MTDSVTIDGITFQGDGTTDWIYRSLPGWYSGAPIRGESEDYPNSDGQSDIDKAYRTARPLKFSGWLTATTVAEALTRWREFSAIQSDGVPFQIVVEDALGPLTATVSVVGTPDVLEINTQGAEISVSMIAYDPIKYGTPVTVSTGLPTSGGGLEFELFEGGAGGALYFGANGNLGRVTLSNAGTAAVWPSVTVSGELTTGFYLQRLDTGQIVRYDRIVPAGSTVSIDFRTGEVLVDGLSDGSTYLTGYDFWSVAPGASIEVQFNAVGGSSGTPMAEWLIAPGYW